MSRITSVTPPRAHEPAVALEAELDLVGVLLVDEALQLGEALARDDHAAREALETSGPIARSTCARR